jgi:hypothetical protein
MELVTKFMIIIPIFVSLGTPLGYTLVAPHVSIFKYHGARVVSSFYGRLVIGLFWTYIFSVDWLYILYSLLIILIYANSTARWLQKMAW